MMSLRTICNFTRTHKHYTLGTLADMNRSLTLSINNTLIRGFSTIRVIKISKRNRKLQILKREERINQMNKKKQLDRKFDNFWMPIVKLYWILLLGSIAGIIIINYLQYNR